MRLMPLVFGARHPVRALVVALAAAAALAAVSCDSGTSAAPGDGELSCADLSSRYFKDSTGDGFYKVVSPNGGETYHVGDSLKVRVTSGENDSEAIIELAVFREGKSTFIPLPGTPRTRIDTRNLCDWGFPIPDSLSSGGKKTALVSDSLKVRVTKYGQGEFIYDYSDAFFRILPAGVP
jgi:hypothetical protein